MERVNSEFSQKQNLFKYWTMQKIRLVGRKMNALDRYNYLVETGFIINDKIRCKKKGCTGKRADLSLITNNSKAEGVEWNCLKKGCKGTLSARTNTWFSSSKLRTHEILSLSYYWWHEMKPKHLIHDLQFEGHTIVDWSSFCREVAIDEVITKSVPIGGRGKIVEIDESVFARRNYFH